MNLQKVKHTLEETFISICERQQEAESDDAYVAAAEDLHETLDESTEENIQANLVQFVMKYPYAVELLGVFDAYTEHAGEDEKLKAMQDLMKKGDYEDALQVVKGE